MRSFGHLLKPLHLSECLFPVAILLELSETLFPTHPPGPFPKLSPFISFPSLPDAMSARKRIVVRDLSSASRRHPLKPSGTSRRRGSSDYRSEIGPLCSFQAHEGEDSRGSEF